MQVEMHMPEWSALIDVQTAEYESDLSVEMARYKPAHMQDGFIDYIDTDTYQEIIFAHFETVCPDAHHSINIICESGVLRFGVQTKNNGRRDWTLFATEEEAHQYAEILDECGE